MGSLQRRNDSAIEEIGRLESRLQSQQMDLQNEIEMLNEEVQKREDQIYKLKLEKDQLSQQCDHLEEKLASAESSLEITKRQNSTYQLDIKSKDERLASADRQIEEQKTKLRLHKEELDRFEDQIKSNTSTIVHLTSIRDDLEHKVT
jgi:chromosome segregation ATPase